MSVSPKIHALKEARIKAVEMAREILLREGDGLAAARALSDAQDKIIIELFSALIVPHLGEQESLDNVPLCLCAIGGYGRGELAPGSDIDLLLLYDEYLPDEMGDVYTEMLYALWDIGLKVGHALRRPDECAKIATEDTVSATAIMDVRLLVGNDALVDKLHDKLKAKNNAKADRAFIAAKLAERDKRHARQGQSRYMVEPHIKDGKGGLRDLQTLGWLAKRLSPQHFNTRTAIAQYIDEQSLHQYDRTLRFLWTVRFWLHLIAERAEDRLSFDLQPELARAMGYRDTPAAERLMKSYFIKAGNVGMMTRVFCTQLEMIAAKRAPTGLSRFIPQRRKGLKTKGFVTESGRLDFINEKSILADPINLVRLFETADAIGCDIHPGALRATRRHLSLIKASFHNNPVATNVFFNCLSKSRDPETLLRIMSESGVLGRILPEYGQIIGRTQFNMYHRYTVDEHTLRAIGVLHGLLENTLENGPKWTASIANSIQHRRVLYLAMLLHDTGKGKGDQQIAGAQAASQACARLGLGAEETRLVSWLVGHHLLMSDTAQRRDLGDPHTILNFAQIVQTPARLRLLTLLTIADINAVGPQVWNGWKDRLLHELFEATESLYRGKMARNLETLQRDAQTRADAARKTFIGSCKDKGFAENWIKNLGSSYWTAFEDKAILRQGEWAASIALKTPKQGVFIGHVTSGDSTVMRVLTPDAPGLFSNLCGAVSAIGGNIAGARIFTTKDGQAFDIFYIQDHEGKPFGQNNTQALRRLDELAQQILIGEPLPQTTSQRASKRVAAFAVLPSVVFDNDASAELTVIETSGRDRQGLLHDLAHVLWQNQLDVRSAHIATYGARAVDVFYVREENGEKITCTGRINNLGAKLRDVLQVGQTTEQTASFGQTQVSERQ